jgi:hypothetical protein
MSTIHHARKIRQCFEVLQERKNYISIEFIVAKQSEEKKNNKFALGMTCFQNKS